MACKNNTTRGDPLPIDLACDAPGILAFYPESTGVPGDPGPLPEDQPGYDADSTIFPIWGYPVGWDNLAISEEKLVWDKPGPSVTIAVYDLSSRRSSSGILFGGGCDRAHNYNPLSWGNFDASIGVASVQYWIPFTLVYAFRIQDIVDSSDGSQISYRHPDLLQRSVTMADMGQDALSASNVFISLPAIYQAFEKDFLAIDVEYLCTLSSDCSAPLEGFHHFSALVCGGQRWILSATKTNPQGLRDREILGAVRQPEPIYLRLLDRGNKWVKDIDPEIGSGLPFDCEWPWLLLAATGSNEIQYRVINLEEMVAFDLTDNAGFKISGRLDDGKAIYSDNRDGGFDIYITDLVTLHETRITTTPGNQFSGDLEGDWAAWIDDSLQRKDIWVMNLGTREQFCTNCSSW